MTTFTRLLTALGVAAAFPALAVATAQDPKAPEPAPAATPAPAGAVTKVQVEAQEKVVTKTTKKDDAKQAEAEKKADVDKKAEADKKAAAEKKVQAVEVRRGVMLRAFNARAAAAPDLDAMAEQYVPHFLPIMRTEMHLLLTITEATPEQRKAIVAQRQKATKEATKRYTQSQQRMGEFQNSQNYPDPRKLAQEALVGIAKDQVSPEKIATYKAEIERRSEDQKQLAIKNLLAKMDQDLVLTEEQRDKLSASLAKNWNAQWCLSLESVLYTDQYFPSIPDNVVVPHLNPKQTQVWRSTPKNGSVRFGDFNNVLGGVDMNGLFPKDEEPEEKDLEKINGVAVGVPGVAMPVQIMAADVAVEVEAVKDEPKKEEAKKDAAKKDEAKKDAAKKDDKKKDDKKKDDKDAPKANPKS